MVERARKRSIAVAFVAALGLYASASKSNTANNDIVTENSGTMGPVEGDGGRNKGNNPGPFTTDNNQVTPDVANSYLHLSEQGYSFLQDWEQYGADIYDAGDGLSTIGYGHVIKSAAEGKKYANGITETEALELLKGDMPYYENLVKKAITTYLSQNQFDALVIFTFNMGRLSRADQLVDAVNNRVSNSQLQGIWYQYTSSRPNLRQGVLNRRMDEFQIWTNRNYTRDY